MAFETLDLSRIYQAAEQVKGMRREAELDPIRRQYLQTQVSNAQQAGDFARQDQEAEVSTREATQHFLSAQAIESADDPVTAAQQYAPDLIQHFERANGPGSFARLAPEQIKKLASQAKQKSAAMAGINLQPKTDDEPEKIRTLRALQKDPELLALHKSLEAAGANKDSPANVQEWKFYSRLPPQQQASYLEMKRTQQTFLPTIAQVPTLVRPGVANNPTTQQPLTTLPDVATGAATVAGAEAGAKTAATTQAEAQAGLGSALDDITKMEADVKGLLNSKGFDTIYGLSGKLDPRNYAAGTDAANAEARRNQLEAQSFGISIQKMKGLGALSNAEGQKVTAAYTRAIDKNQSEEAAREAWKEVQEYLKLARARAQQKAGVETLQGGAPAPAAGTAPVQIKGDADYAALPSGAIYIDPQGNQRTKR